MQNFKLNEQDILTNQDWTFPTNIAYGPGRLKEIGKICDEFGLWLHVDAAMAGSASICPEYQFIHDGI